MHTFPDMLSILWGCMHNWNVWLHLWNRQAFKLCYYVYLWRLSSGTEIHWSRHRTHVHGRLGRYPRPIARTQKLLTRSLKVGLGFYEGLRMTFDGSPSIRSSFVI